MRPLKRPPADLLLHVVDSASEDREGQIAAVNGVLEDRRGSLPQIQVWNKIDATLASPEVSGTLVVRSRAFCSAPERAKASTCCVKCSPTPALAPRRNWPPPQRQRRPGDPRRIKVPNRHSHPLHHDPLGRFSAATVISGILMSTTTAMGQGRR